MAARSSFTRTSGGVITSAWANSMRDHLIPYSGAADGVTEGMLSVDTATDQVRIGTGAATVEFGCYGTSTAITSGMGFAQTGFVVSSYTMSGNVTRYGKHVVGSGSLAIVSVTSAGTAGNLITFNSSGLHFPAVATQRCVGSYVFQDASSTFVWAGALIMTAAGDMGMYGAQGSNGAIGIAPSIGLAASDTVWFSINYHMA
mgnify:CR=1 FL=1